MNADKSRMPPIHALQLTTGFLLVIIAGVGGTWSPEREVCSAPVKAAQALFKAVCHPPEQASLWPTLTGWAAVALKTQGGKHKVLT